MWSVPGIHSGLSMSIKSRNENISRETDQIISLSAFWKNGLYSDLFRLAIVEFKKLSELFINKRRNPSKCASFQQKSHVSSLIHLLLGWKSIFWLDVSFYPFT